MFSFETIQVGLDIATAVSVIGAAITLIINTNLENKKILKQQIHENKKNSQQQKDNIKYNYILKILEDTENIKKEMISLREDCFRKNFFNETIEKKWLLIESLELFNKLLTCYKIIQDSPFFILLPDNNMKKIESELINNSKKIIEQRSKLNTPEISNGDILKTIGETYAIVSDANKFLVKEMN